MLVRGLALGVSCFVVFATEAALAGCPSTCQIDVSPVVTVTPELPCVAVRTTGSTCECGVRAEIITGCVTPLEFPEQTLSPCGPQQRPDRHECAMLNVTESGFIMLRASDDGHKQWTVKFTTAGVAHEARVEADIHDFDDQDGCNCSLPGGAAAPPPPHGYAVALGIPLWLALRAHGRRCHRRR